MPQDVNMEVEYVDIMSIKPNPNNPRIHPESEIKKLVNSIQTLGFANPILVDKTMTIISGHARLKAAKNAEIETVPIIKLDLDEDEAKAYMIADNRIANESQWDNSKLESLMEDIYKSNLSLDATGFDTIEYERILKDTFNQMEDIIPQETDDDIPFVGMHVNQADMVDDTSSKRPNGQRIPVGDDPSNDPEPTYVIMITFNDKDKADNFLTGIGVEKEMEGYTIQVDGNELE